MAEKEKAARPRAARPKGADKTSADKAPADKTPAVGKSARPSAATRTPAGPKVVDPKTAGPKAAGSKATGPTIVDTRAGWSTPADDPSSGDKSLIDQAVDDKDKIDAIVSPRTDDPTARVVAGARVRNCAQCLADVFVAPSTFAYFKGRTMPPIWCVACAMLAAETHGTSPRTGRA